MLKIGEMNELEICEITDKGCFLAAEGEKLFIPRSQMKDEDAPGVLKPVFLYYDDGRLTATARRPRALMGEAACLKVKGSNSYGYFLDNAIRKDVFLPFDEAGCERCAGEEILVYLYLDHQKRMCATTRFARRFSDLVAEGYAAGDHVKALPVAVTDIGIKAVVDNLFYAMFLKKENQDLSGIKIGRKIQAVIRRIRSDSKVDLVPATDEHAAAAGSAGGENRAAPKPYEREFRRDEKLAAMILDRLEEHGGFLPFGDRTPPEEIQRVFGVSKGKFKKAIGHLYRSKAVELSDEGIRAVSSADSGS
ncbi:MAG: hypothetical protein IJ523_01450 [Succinivibrionaceae bacterium]|nr:hypothetical protein [Succinivibrionaceae bacterium]